MKQTSDVYIKKINNINCRFVDFICEDGSTLTKNISKSHGTHNLSNSRLYSIWKGMRHRCSNPNRPGYKYYGGKGIKVCDIWDGKNGFKNFYEWSMKNGYSDELTIDRVDSNDSYNPNNCQWIPYNENRIKGISKKRMPKYKFTAYNYDKNIMVIFYKPGQFQKRFGVDFRRISECCLNKRESYNGWNFIREDINVFESQETILYWSTMEDEFPLEVQSISQR